MKFQNKKMTFLRSLKTGRVLLYLIIIGNLTTCFFNATKQDEETRLISDCKYSYPNYRNSNTQLVEIDMICRNMLVSEIPFYENVTKMELINVPLSLLNETEIPKTVQSERVALKQLRWVKSHIKIIASIPIEHLIELDLSWNIIQDIRLNAFKRLKLLQKLNISYNEIETLPNTLFDQYNSLKSFSLAYNQLNSLPSNLFDNLNQLEILDLSNNHVKRLKETLFQNNVNLLNLNLSYNKISHLSGKVFQSLSSLQYLSLENNQLFDLEPDIFSKLRELMVLNIEKNPLRSLPITLLPDNNTLFTLTISHTKLNKIKPSTLQNLRHLRSLYVTDNVNLQNLHNETFANLQNLKVIHLQNNNFTHLPSSIVNTNPQDLYLDGNQWPCDCSVQWIVFWAYSSGSRKNSRRLTAYCNETNKDLLESLYKMHCKPTIIRVSPASYRTLEEKVKLVCKAYAHPTPTIGWITPNGLVYVESNPTYDPSGFYPASKNHKHLQNTKENVYLYENGELDIKRMSRDDAGEYVCIATNRIGESFAHTRLFVDPTIMQRIKTGSIICGLLWVNTFLMFSIVYVLIRRCSRR